MQYSLVKKPLENIYKKIFRADNILPFLFFLVLFYSIISFLFSDHSIKNYLTKEREKEKLLKDIDKLKSENEKLQNLINQLKTDPYIIEKKAREDLGLMKKGDEIFIILDDKEVKKEKDKDNRWIEKVKKIYKEFYMKK